MIMKKICRLVVVLAISTCTLLAGPDTHATRIKDIASFLGDRPNQLIGYGLVVGLNGSGDKNKTQFTLNTLANLLDNMGIRVDPQQMRVKNIAAVMVTAKLPPFVRQGSRIDVQVSSVGDAKSLEGGTLLMTPLQGPDAQTYAVAQGPISTGGFSVSGAGGNSVQKNHPTVGFISGGALVEKEVPLSYGQLNELDLVLKNPDFSTASKVSQTVKNALGGSFAEALDAGTIRVRVPPGYEERLVALISLVEALEIEPDATAKIVINERTGTIVIGQNVRISPVAVAHGNLTVQISSDPLVSQPPPFSEGQTVVVPQSTVEVKEGKGHLSAVGGETTIGDIIKGLNAIGATPRDLINILQAIKAAGALRAELEII